MPTHGLPATYKGRYRCRCEACRQANTEAQRKDRERRRQRDIPDWVQHNRSTYANWTCRCVVCTEDNARSASAYRSRD